MLIQLTIGLGMILTTVLFHAFSLDFILQRVKILEQNIELKKIGYLRKSLLLSIAVLGVVAVLIAEMWLWVLVYLLVGAFSNVEPALYYSMASFTTVGYGDLILDHNWRLLGGIESTNGFLLFGWSTAFIFEITSIIYKNKIRF